jgi:hypothetical protein
MLRRGFVLVALAGCTADVSVLEVSADEPFPAELREGDIVRAGEISLVVPAPGETVSIAVDRDDGTTFDLAIENPVDAPVRIVPPRRSQGELPELAPGNTALPVAETVVAEAVNPCTDGAYVLQGFHWAVNYRWFFDAGSTPSANSQANVEVGLRTAANAITQQRNSCGFADQVSATNSYGGRTTKTPNIPNSSTTVRCGTRDGSNVVGFGTLPPGYLGLTCSWWDGNNAALEADVKLATRYAWFAEAVPAGCSNKYGIEQVGTHEFGHAFGLAHVSQSAHAELTMSPISSACSNGKLTLGLGDVRGLRAIY